MAAMRLRISGRVQGVGFRYSACAEARRLGLAGWARNCADGSVEIHAQGPDEALGAFVAWCGEGPALARVDSVETRDVEPSPELGAAFGIRA